MSVITVIGAGQMPVALTFPLFENGHEVRIVGTSLDEKLIDRLKEDNYHLALQRTLHDGIKYYYVSDVEKAMEGADLILCGMSSFGAEWFGKEIIPMIPENVPMISVTKGLIDDEEGNMTTYLDYWKDFLPKGKDLNMNAIGGPCIARALADHEPSFVSFCGPDIEILKWIRSLFSTDYYIINLTNDVIGLEGAVAFKNAYALATALAIGIKEKEGDDGIGHHNTKAAVFQQSIKEMLDLIQLIGGGVENIMYAAGDLDVTAAAGRSRQMGVLLGKGYTIEEATEELKGVTLESVVIATRTARAIKSLAKAGKVRLEDFPLLMHVDALLNEGATVNIPWKDFEIITER